jgi:hypothetical protein
MNRYKLTEPAGLEMHPDGGLVLHHDVQQLLSTRHREDQQWVGKIIKQALEDMTDRISERYENEIADLEACIRYEQTLRREAEWKAEGKRWWRFGR